MNKTEEKAGDSDIRYCPCCKHETKQKLFLYNPDDPSQGQVWECTVCHENTGTKD